VGLSAERCGLRPTVPAVMDSGKGRWGGIPDLESITENVGSVSERRDGLWQRRGSL